MIRWKACLGVVSFSLGVLPFGALAEEKPLPPAQLIQQYTGRYPRIDEPLMKAAYTQEIAIVDRYYGRGTADWDQKDGQVVLNEKTVDYLYTGFTPLALHYQPGSRPFLERLVGRLIRPEMSEREKARAIVKYCETGFKREYPNPLPGRLSFLNATEEEILKLGGGECEDRARLVICLCQIAGLPARFIATYEYFRPEEGYATHGGHAIVEIYLEGGWALFDTSIADFYCQREDGRIANLWDILRHPELVENQPESVYKDCGQTKAQFIAYRNEYVSPRGVATITNYYVWDYWRYDWNWIPNPPESNKQDPFIQSLQRYEDEVHRKVLSDIGVPADKIK